MVFRDYITEEMQQRWFASINNRFNFYSVIHYAGEAIGLSHTKNVDWDAMSGEGGMMIWSKPHQNSVVPFRAALAGTDWMFGEFGLRTIIGRVLKTNKRALRYDRALGYVFEPDDPNSQTLVGRLTPESYERATAALRRVLTCQTT
jgi:RimJ/RimL family protein N-acetyltransferase